MNKIYTGRVVDILENGDAILELPQDMLDELGWKYGDKLDFAKMNNSVIIKNLTKEEKENASST
jgi:antitoxin component of MazEF toxin-antitoxin module